jgi:hypothetical protein
MTGLLVDGCCHFRLRFDLFAHPTNPGVTAILAGADVVRYLPPFVVSDEDLDRAAGLLGDTLPTSVDHGPEGPRRV